MRFLDYFKFKTPRKGNTNSVLFFHEDVFRQIELVPKENISSVKQQCTQINDLSQDNCDCSSYTDVFIRNENPIELAVKQIAPVDLENMLTDYKFRRASEVLTGYGEKYRISAPDTAGFGHDYAGIFYNFKGNAVNAIWLTRLEEIDQDNLELFLNNAGLKWGLLLVDWTATEFIDLSDRQAIINYLEL